MTELKEPKPLRPKAGLRPKTGLQPEAGVRPGVAYPGGDLFPAPQGIYPASPTDVGEGDAVLAD